MGLKQYFIIALEYEGCEETEDSWCKAGQYLM